MTNPNTSFLESDLAAADDEQGIPDIAPGTPAAALLRAAETLRRGDAPPDVLARARRTVERLIGLAAAYGFGQCCPLYDRLTAGVFTKCTETLAVRHGPGSDATTIAATVRELGYGAEDPYAAVPEAISEIPWWRTPKALLAFS